MPLEAIMVVLDNSEWMRNGDFVPSRLQAQNDAVNVIFGAKTDSNPENTVGLMTMAGKGPQVLVSLTRDIGKILTALHGIKLEGSPSMTNGIQVAQLVLKHRQNKNQVQRIVVFVGSPISAEEKELVRLGKKLKKNNVAVDIINFGEEAHNTAKLEAFIDAVKSNDNSHLITIPPGPHVLSELIFSSPIISGDGGAPAGFGASSAGGFEFGIDPNLDPELALALRISLEEERARQESERIKQTPQEGGAAAPSGFTVEEPAAISGSTEDDMLAQALAMSMGHRTTEDVAMEELTEEEQMARAIQMSIAGETVQGHDTQQDPNVLANVLGTLPGVDQDDPRIQSALNKNKQKDDKK